MIRAAHGERERGEHGRDQKRQQDVSDVLSAPAGCLQENHPFVAAARSRKLNLQLVLIVLQDQEN